MRRVGAESCGGVGTPKSINLFRDLDPIRWRQLDHNPIALLSEFTPERLEMRASELVLYSRINQAYRRLKEYVAKFLPGGGPTPACSAPSRWPTFPWSSGSTSRCPSIPAAWACFPATTSRAPAAWACPGGHRPVLRPGLFQAAPRHQRLAARGISRHEGRKPADGARPGHRRQADYGAHRHPHRQAAGQGVADARRAGATCTCWTATYPATVPKIAN